MAKRHGSLFTGLAGFTIAADWAGYETVLHCEIEPFCQAVERKHYPHIPILGGVGLVGSR
jgi:DNA (cytosine-5)-methyltransferase 1